MGATNKEIDGLQEAWYRGEHMCIFAHTAENRERRPWKLLQDLQMNHSRWARYVGRIPRRQDPWRRCKSVTVLV
jgi:hypothetical protein